MRLQSAHCQNSLKYLAVFSCSCDVIFSLGTECSSPLHTRHLVNGCSLSCSPNCCITCIICSSGFSLCITSDWKCAPLPNAAPLESNTRFSAAAREHNCAGEKALL